VTDTPRPRLVGGAPSLDRATAQDGGLTSGAGAPTTWPDGWASGTAEGPLATTRRLLERAVAHPAAFPVVIGVLSRLYSAGLLIVADQLKTYQSLLINERSTFLQWDGQWYMRIAQTGYHSYAIQTGGLGGHHDYAFFPGWPALMRGLSTLGLYFANRGKPRQPLLAAATMLVRITGVAIMVSAAVMWLRDRRQSIRLLSAATVAVAFAAWWVYIWILTHNPMGWFNGSAAWFDSLGFEAIGKVFERPDVNGVAQVGIIFAMLIAAVFLCRRNLELGVYSVMAIVMSVVGAPIASMPRHAMVAFPVFGLLADRLGTRATIALTIAFAVMQLWFVGLTFTGRWPVPP
jgi:hypothetical protein